MNCEEARLILAEAVFEEGSPEGRAAAGHLAGCAACRARVEAWRKALQAAGPSPRLPEDFWIRQKAAIAAKLPSRQEARRRHWSRVLVPTAAALMVALSLWRRETASRGEQMLIAQDAEMIQDLDLLDHFDVLENFMDAERA